MDLPRPSEMVLHQEHLSPLLQDLWGFAWKLSTAGSQLKEGRWWGSEGPAESAHGLNVNFEFTQSQAVFFPALVSPLWT